MPERHVSRAEIARQLRVTERTVTNWVRDDDFPRRVRGRRVTFPEDRCFAWHIEFKQAEALRRSRADEPVNLETTRARKLQIEVRLAELELGLKEGELIDRVTHDEALGTICDRLRAKVLNAPGKWASRTVGLRTIAESLVIWQEAMNELLAALSAIGDELEPDDAEHVA